VKNAADLCLPLTRADRQFSAAYITRTFGVAIVNPHHNISSRSDCSPGEDQSAQTKQPVLTIFSICIRIPSGGSPEWN